MAGVIYEIQSAGYGYGEGLRALDDISLSIAEGERIAILGANGSGKSTLLKLLDALIFTTSGEIKAFGKKLCEETLRDPAFRRMFRQKVGFIFQDSDVQLFCPTVWEEVTFAPLQLGLDENEVVLRASDALALLGISGLRDRFPYQLSGGEKKRVAIAATLTANPDVLLLDEPTNGLDPRTQKALVELLWGLSKAGKTIVISTNDLSILEDVSDRVLVLSEEHRFLALGQTSDILGNMELLLKANLIHEHLHRHGDDLHLHRHTHIPDHEHRHFQKSNGRHSHRAIKLTGLSCAQCASLLEHLVAGFEGVEQARFVSESAEIEIHFDPRIISYDQLAEKIRHAYPAKD